MSTTPETPVAGAAGVAVPELATEIDNFVKKLRATARDVFEATRKPVSRRDVLQRLHTRRPNMIEAQILQLYPRIWQKVFRPEEWTVSQEAVYVPNDSTLTP